MNILDCQTAAFFIYCADSVRQTASLVIRREQWPVERILASSALRALVKPDHHTFACVRVHATVTLAQTKAVSV